jgi:hypothetical protein
VRLFQTLIILFLPFFKLKAQDSGIKGKITDEKGVAVPFVSIGIEKGTGGTIANEEGEFRLPLETGEYTILFQCIGYKSEKRLVNIFGGFETLQLTMSEQVLQTREVLIAPGNEDPAYAIMRKSIARARINRMLVDAYTAEAYIRGSGRIIDMPTLLKPLLRKQGIEPNTIFFKESLEDIQFRQPNTFIEKVKASRSNFGKMEVRQSVVKYELYSPSFGGIISPLSPSAFRYYRFQYLGAFSDFKHEVFKIKVIPRREGDDVWTGEISIVDGLWCIHSADLTEKSDDFTNRLRQEYLPVEGIWLPSHIRLDARGKALGVEFEAVYNGVLRKYNITKNEKLYADFKKLEQQLDEKTDEAIRANPQKPDLKQREKEDKKMLRQLAKAYVKERFLKRKKENKEKNIPASVVSSRVFLEDSTSINNDTVFWNQNRPVPLTIAETKSFTKMDSVYKKAEKKDSSRKWVRGLLSGVSVVLAGKTFSLGKADSLKRKPWELKYFSPLGTLGFNAAEGYHLNQCIWLKYAFGQSTSRLADQRNYIQFGPDLRYSFGREKLLASGVLQFGTKHWTIQASGGSGIRQFAGNEVINPALNFYYARFLEKNLMKVYQSDYLRLDVLRKLSGRLEAELNLQLENRLRLQNSPFRSIGGKDFVFEPNGIGLPSGPGIDSLADPGRKAEIQLAFTWYPTLVSGLYNEQQFFRQGNSPAIKFKVQHAMPGIAGSVADFTRLEIGWIQSIALARGTSLEVSARSAAFLRRGFVAPMDASHVWGNQTTFIDGSSLEQFRQLPYYRYSNSSRISELHLQFYRDRLLFGWLFPADKTWREGLIGNLLATPGRPLFREFGYAVDRLFGMLHTSVVASAEEGSRLQWRFMLGMSYQLNFEPKSYNRRQ